MEDPEEKDCTTKCSSKKQSCQCSIAVDHRDNKRLQQAIDNKWKMVEGCSTENRLGIKQILRYKTKYTSLIYDSFYPIYPTISSLLFNTPGII